MIFHGLKHQQVIIYNLIYRMLLTHAYTGEYFFACWNTKQIEPLSLYWTNQGINVLISKRQALEKMLKNRNKYSHSDRHQLCRIPPSKLYFG